MAPLTLALIPLSCAPDAQVSAATEMTIYTCVSDPTIQPIITQFESEHPGTEVGLFRAPTGELNARVAGDIRSGGLKADVVWACDPLTMAGYVSQDLVGGWTPDGAADIEEQFRTDDYVGAAVLYVVAAYRDGVPEPKSWSDLAGGTYDSVAVPDPNVAASALGALGYFSQAPDYGTDFYTRLKQGGAKQVSTPDNVTTGVAQGVYQAGITVANSAYLAQSKGSPIKVAWPKPGAVAIYGPIALAKQSASSTLAKDFISFVISEPGQQIIAKAGSYPTRTGVKGPEVPADAPVVFPDWAKITANKDTLLSDYQQIFDG